MEKEQDTKGHNEILINSEISKTHIREFFKIVEKGIRKHGVQKIASVLKTLDVESDFIKQKIDTVVKNICEAVICDYIPEKVKIQDLFNKSRRGDVTVARKMTIILLKQHLNISDDKIGRLFGRSRQIVFYTLRDFKMLDPSNKFDIIFLSRYDRINNKVLEFIDNKESN